MTANQYWAISPNSPACPRIHASMDGSRSTALGNCRNLLIAMLVPRAVWLRLVKTCLHALLRMSEPDAVKRERKKGGSTALFAKPRESHFFAGSTFNFDVTCFTPLMVLAWATALSASAWDFTVPFKVTAPFLVSTSIAIPGVSCAASRSALIFDVIQASETTSDASLLV